jgi:hypothetical protein
VNKNSIPIFKGTIPPPKKNAVKEAGIKEMHDKTIQMFLFLTSIKKKFFQ